MYTQDSSVKAAPGINNSYSVEVLTPKKQSYLNELNTILQEKNKIHYELIEKLDRIVDRLSYQEKMPTPEDGNIKKTEYDDFTTSMNRMLDDYEHCNNWLRNLVNRLDEII